jgi:oligosaccharyltransferase complex subunit gamma
MPYLTPLTSMFEPEFRMAVKAWGAAAKGAPDDLAYFAQLDFLDGPDIFQKHKLVSAPFVFHYPPTEGPMAKRSSRVEYEVYDVSRKGVQAESLVRWVESQLQGKVSLRVQRPVDKGQLALFITTVACVGVMVWWSWHAFMAVVCSRTLWTMMTLSFILVMTGGQMWNQQRNPPYIGGNANSPHYFADGQMNQHGVETPIVAAMCTCGVYRVFSGDCEVKAHQLVKHPNFPDGTLSLLFLALFKIVPSIADPGKQRAMGFSLCVAFLVAFGFMMRVFRWKLGYYPFKLIF